MIIHSDWHIHSEYSYDSSLPLAEIGQKAKQFGFKKFGITDHVNFNDETFLGDLKRSVINVKQFRQTYPEAVLGVELTPIEKPQFDYIAKNGTREGYVAPILSAPYEIELAQTKEALIACGVRYAIGAAHWRVDVPDAKHLPTDLDACMKEWYRQQMWLACDERVTVLGHPWYNGRGIWYDDFSVIPRSMNTELASALKENGKYVECNSHFFTSPKATEKFRHQYAEFIRALFENGIPVTYGSDAHNEYKNVHLVVEKYLISAGFKDGDFSEIADEHLW
jgi:histidinol phosphatase-like PHP family hydrolase